MDLRLTILESIVEPQRRWIIVDSVMDLSTTLGLIYFSLRVSRFTSFYVGAYADRSWQDGHPKSDSEGS